MDHQLEMAQQIERSRDRWHHVTSKSEDPDLDRFVRKIGCLMALDGLLVFLLIKIIDTLRHLQSNKCGLLKPYFCRWNWHRSNIQKQSPYHRYQWLDKTVSGRLYPFTRHIVVIVSVFTFHVHCKFL